MTPDPTRHYIYRWNRQGRRGQPCVVTARGTMNSCRVRFDDGYTMVTSRNALRRDRTAGHVETDNACDRATVARVARGPVSFSFLQAKYLTVLVPLR